MVLQILDLPAEREVKHKQFVHKMTLIFSKTQLWYFSAGEWRVIKADTVSVSFQHCTHHFISYSVVGRTAHALTGKTPSADKDSCNGGQEDGRQEAFYKTIYFVISLALFWRLQILFFTFLNADILSGRKESYQVLKRPFLLRSISMMPLNSRKNCYAINIWWVLSPRHGRPYKNFPKWLRNNSFISFI